MIIKITIMQERLRTDTFTQYLNGKEVKDLINEVNVVFNIMNTEYSLINMLTCNFIGHFSVMCQVFSFNQYQVRTFLLSISNRHQLHDAHLPCHIVTGDYNTFLLNT